MGRRWKPLVGRVLMVVDFHVLGNIRTEAGIPGLHAAARSVILVNCAFVLHILGTIAIAGT